VFRRIVSLLLIGWLLGLAWFVVSLPQPSGKTRTDGVIVLTGGAGRIERGISVLKDGLAQRMLVSGVDPAVRPVELAEVQDVPVRLVNCCIDLGKQAIDTRSNGIEAALWAKTRKFKSVRLVTTDWHMPRARFELARAMGDEVKIVPDAVESAPTLTVLFREYNKLLARYVAAVFGI
jgi:uncharacterized SAM-binding protein YcdF (DUF218 family)